MKQKTLYYLATAFVVLLIINFVTKPRVTSTNIDDIVQTIVIGVAAEDVKNVEVYKEAADSKIELQFSKQDDQWRIPSYFQAKAQKNSVDGFIADVLEMQGKVRATGIKFFDQFEINDHQGIHILLKDDTQKVLANVVIGKKGDDLGSCFVRFADREKIFFADKDLLSTLKITGSVDTLTAFNAASFVDNKSVDMNVDELQTIALINGGDDLVVTRIEKDVVNTENDTLGAQPDTVTAVEWVLQEGDINTALDQDAAKKFLTDVRTIRTQKVVDRIGQSFGDMNKSSQYGFSNKKGIIFITRDNQRQQILFGKAYEKDAGYYMKTDVDGLVYQISKHNYEKMFKWMQDLPGKIKN